MSDLDNSLIKRKIESQKCSKHNEKPQFIKTQKEFEIKACCEDFRTILFKKSKSIIAEETKKMMKNI
ncbi:hypothetical protein LF887_14365 [Chryseobacterium sp. MEBOG06]|uniref:hypothetical protein n=1 Tax=Chryseobacterium sp. MEBOG06 TaxID=2879938 RepID=UPI001F3C35DC|nr:hypothetical protein [Chryseobacterium sp. MEBOG06]UKB82190.1 hypothetical protein LF887_14365 [Chryseobacterium sp. MEBOG06]